MSPHAQQASMNGNAKADLPIDEHGRLYHLGLRRGEGNNSL